MSDELKFTMTFHTPFLTSTGAAAEGYDASVDLSQPLTASAVKGLMRAAAVQILGLRPDLVDRVFGSVRTPTRWQWIVAQPNAEVKALNHHRVEIDAETRTAVDNHLQLSRVAFLDSICFTVEHWGDGDADPEERVAVIASARAVHAIGAQRRRGLGWVGVSGPDLTNDDYERLTGRMRA